MFDLHANNPRGRSKSLLAGGVALSVALMLGTAAPSFAQVNCPVTYSIPSQSLAAFQFEVAIEPGAVALGDFESCEAVNSGIIDLNTDGNSLEVGWASDSGAVTGVTAVAICRFIGTGAVSDTDVDNVTVLDCLADDDPLVFCGAPPVTATVGTCSECGNGIVEEGEQCETTDPRCLPNCQLEGTCSDSPLPGCITSTEAGKSKLQFKDNADNTKDSAQYALNKGPATTIATFGADPAVTPSLTYKLCVYDGDGLVADHEVPSEGTCDGKPCWSGAPKKYQYKSKSAAADGVAQIKLQPGAAGKTKVQVKLKSKAGTFVAPPLPLTEPGVRAQLVTPAGCFETAFPAATKNEASQYSAKGP